MGRGDRPGDGWGHAGTGGNGGGSYQPRFKGEKKGVCDRTGAIAIALTVLGFVLDPFRRGGKRR